jgi:hypothetical protein
MIAKETLTGSIVKPAEDKGSRMLAVAALAERDPLGQARILEASRPEASRLRKEKAALERPNYHLTAEKPALVHAVSAAGAVAGVAGAVATWQ